MVDHDDETSPPDIETRIRHLAAGYDGEAEDLLSTIVYILNALAARYTEFKSLARDFDDAESSFQFGYVRTLDEAFGVTGKWKGVSLERYRFWFENGYDIYHKIKMLTNPDRPRGAKSQEEAFELIAEEYEGQKAKPSTIRDIYRWYRETRDEYWDELEEAAGPGATQRWFKAYGDKYDTYK